ncbi:MAG: ribosome biogenesis GTPase Der [Proteobacteria bacterium]|nr:ribosome biogenesis GTPase Der [Pseudomonadota bacterium]
MQVAIVGKPNVGKSSLFNKLCGKKLAIVDDTPGVTRDRKRYEARIGDLKFTLIDTAGWEHDDALLKGKMNAQSAAAIAEADMIWFTVDGRGGLTPDDFDLARLVRKTSKPVLLLVNKSEGKIGIDVGELTRLGLGEPIYLSVHASLGFEEIYQRASRFAKTIASKEEALEPAEEDSKAIKMAIIGRPNVGKSSLLNKLLGDERVITSELSGTTRDTTTHPFQWQQHNFELIDTAGVRKRGKIDNRLEDMSVGESINAIRRAHIVVLVIEATEGLLSQDMAIANIAINEGKAFVLVVNKCDLIRKKRELKDETEYQLSHHLREVTGVPTLYISALRDKRDVVSEVLEAAAGAHKRWAKKVGTGVLNRWLAEATAAHILPLAENGRRIRLKYAVQNSTKPPTFTIFANIPEDLPDSYTKYLANSLREHFGMQGLPLRLNYRKNANPYNKTTVSRSPRGFNKS